MQILNADDRRTYAWKGRRKNLPYRLMKTSLPKMGADAFDLRVVEGIKASHIGYTVFPVSDQIFRPGFDLLSYHIGRVTLANLPCPAQEIDEGKVGDVLAVGITMSPPFTESP